MAQHQYNSLEDIAARKAEMSEKRNYRSEEIEQLWEKLSTPEPANTRAEMISGIISKSIVAFDAFMLVRKLSRQYGSIMSIFKKKKKRKS